MSVEALSWLAQRAPGVKPHWVGPLFGLCNHADEHGKGSHPSQATLAWYARKDERVIREDLRAMEAAGLIRKGDQRMVAHLPPDKRPVVWDLAMERDRGPRPEPGKPGRPARKRAEPEIPPDAQHPPITAETGGAVDPPGCTDPPVSDLGKPENGGMSGVKRGDPELRQTLVEENQDPSTSRSGEEEPTAAPETPNPNPAERVELTADEHALAAEICAAAPRWSPYSVRKVLAEPEIRERADRPLVRLAFLHAAADPRTRTPYRLLHDACPVWDRAVAELYPAEAQAAADEQRRVPVIGPAPWCGDPGCDQTTRTLVDRANGFPRPGRPRCPACHPQSPAVSP